MINCISNNNKTHGYFTELNTVHTIHSKGFRLFGYYASVNRFGFTEGGSNGAIASACQFIENTDSGVYIARSPANALSGEDGLIIGCALANYGNACAHIREVTTGGYRFVDNQLLNNKYGVLRSALAALLSISRQVLFFGEPLQEPP